MCLYGEGVESPGKGCAITAQTEKKSCGGSSVPSWVERCANPGGECLSKREMLIQERDAHVREGC